MFKYCDIKGLPESIELFTETESFKINVQKDILDFDNVQINFYKSADGLKISISAEKLKIKNIILHWYGDLEEDVKILGGSFERAYGNMEWRGIVFDRPMPWYCLIKLIIVHFVQSVNNLLNNLTNYFIVYIIK